MNRIRQAITFFFLTLLFVLIISPVELSANENVDELDWEEVINKQLDEYGIPGATAVIYHEGETIANIGAGWADIENEQEVQSDKTLFHLGSLHQWATWVGLLQLIEEREVRFNEPVQRHLDIDGLFDDTGRQVTIKHLLNHTSGFAETKNLSTSNEDHVLPLSEYLHEFTPAVIQQPGSEVMYSEYGVALAGQIIEEASGQSYESYIEENVLNQLDIEGYDIGQRPRDSESVSVGYINNNEQVPAEWSNVLPANGGYATSEAMVSVIELFLGEREGILSTPSLERMLTTQFTHDERLPGLTDGLYEKDVHGERWVVQEGESNSFQSLLAVHDDSNTGVFVSYNHPEGLKARDDLLEKVTEKYIESENAAIDPVKNDEMEPSIGEYTGSYMMNRAESSSFHAISDLLFRTVRVNEGNESLMIDGYTFFETGEHLFIREDGKEQIAFATNEFGAIDRLVLDNRPLAVAYKQAWHESQVTHLLWIGVSVFTFITTMVSIIIRFIRQVRRKGRHTGKKTHLKRGDMIAFIQSLFYIAGLASVLWIIGTGTVYEHQTFTVVSLLMLILGAVMSVLLIPSLIVRWRDDEGKAWMRVFFGFHVFISMFFIMFLSYWNLLGFHY
ncbi:serine hydrolase domain-containing protein [Texcoconibacillus texcoconensis]|uniref:CubicO group peptidase (Beta-lactamase class C family) n=1 Tax=Texcoconibacillus texcoconensis TaxID=1095777 RepID=A0A840QPG0_9BACI|nr:serine hydrolase domain-containing protein [Texcoconibacillus texcoconensis]MBB5173296.1 CubicO group peptidase (beta-lactamase class C family) [Texcoconibacillus texcoconensis]